MPERPPPMAESASPPAKPKRHLNAIEEAVELLLYMARVGGSSEQILAAKAILDSAGPEQVGWAVDSRARRLKAEIERAANAPAPDAS
jgi:hypothetical protein